MGKIVVADLVWEAVSINLQEIFLEVRVSNEAALTLYGQAGFQIIDKRKNYYEKPKEDAYIMEWNETYITNMFFQ